MSEIIEQAMKIHREAMNFSDEAQIAQIEGADKSKVLDFTRKAFELEKRAAMLLQNEKGDLVTRTVLFRGAAVLALDCNELDEAEKLIELGLSDDDAPPQIAGELQDLKRVVESKRRTKLREATLSLNQTESFLTTVTPELNEELLYYYTGEVEDAFKGRGAFTG